MAPSKRKTQTRPPVLLGNDMTPSAYQRGVDAHKAQNKRVLDSLGAPQLERAPKRCGPAF